MYAISATRLRYELNKPTSDINLIYGEEDLFKPSIEWFEEMNLSYRIIEGVGDEVYSNKCYLGDICDEIRCNL